VGGGGGEDLGLCAERYLVRMTRRPAAQTATKGCACLVHASKLNWVQRALSAATGALLSPRASPSGQPLQVLLTATPGRAGHR
jgi:hypothetical protein